MTGPALTSATDFECPAELAPILEALEALDLEPRALGGTLRALCPVHEADGQPHSPSLSVFLGRDDQPALKCHSGCTPRDVWRALKGNGELAGTAGHAPRARRPLLPHADIRLIGTWDDDTPAPGGWAPDPSDWPDGAVRVEHVASYRYTDAEGVRLLAVRDRYHFTDFAGVRTGKTFRQRVPVTVMDARAGRETVRWAAPSRAGVTLPLYGLPALYDGVEGRAVYVVEGEKDALAFVHRGLTAVTAPDGAEGWKLAHTEQLRAGLLPDEVVRLVGDADTAGARWRDRLLPALAGVPCEEAQLVA